MEKVGAVLMVAAVACGCLGMLMLVWGMALDARSVPLLAKYAIASAITLLVPAGALLLIGQHIRHRNS